MTDGLPTFVGAELHVHISGAISAALVPWWLHWLRYTSPGVPVNVSISPNAKRFVSYEALQALLDGEVWVDDWDTPALPHSWREGRSGNSQCIVVLPATQDTIMRLAQGRADSPALMMMQLSDLPIVIASVSPVRNEVSEYWIALLARRENVHFAPHVAGVRADDRTAHDSGFNFPGALAIANEQLRKQ